jgi:hypothetical protein
MVLGLILLKHLYNKSYHKLIKAIHEKVQTVGKKILQQVTDKLEGKKIEDRIVSYYKPYSTKLESQL